MFLLKYSREDLRFHNDLFFTHINSIQHFIFFVDEVLDCCCLPLFIDSQGKEFIYIHLCSCKVTIHSTVTMRYKSRKLSCIPNDVYWCISFSIFQQVSTAAIHRVNCLKEEWGLIISSWILTGIDHFHLYSSILQCLASQHGRWVSVIIPKG